jgi:hypothetical protein
MKTNWKKAAPDIKHKKSDELIAWAKVLGQLTVILKVLEELIKLALSKN